MDPWERFGLDPEEYDKCVLAAEELAGLSSGAPAPSAEELAKGWADAKAHYRRIAIPSLWRALGLEGAVRTLVPEEGPRPSG